jgi:hypothetical protein
MLLIRSDADMLVAGRAKQINIAKKVLEMDCVRSNISYLQVTIRGEQANQNSNDDLQHRNLFHGRVFGLVAGFKRLCPGFGRPRFTSLFSDE